MKIKNYDCGCEQEYKNKKELSYNKCSKCYKTLCNKHAYFYVDGNNRAITKNAKAVCLECMK